MTTWILEDLEDNVSYYQIIKEENLHKVFHKKLLCFLLVKSNFPYQSYTKKSRMSRRNEEFFEKNTKKSE